jgi:hypothetical protein
MLAVVLALAGGTAPPGSASASASPLALPAAVARPLKRRMTDEDDGDSFTARVSSSAPAGGPSVAALPPARCSLFTCTSAAGPSPFFSQFNQAASPHRPKAAPKKPKKTEPPVGLTTLHKYFGSSGAAR